MKRRTTIADARKLCSELVSRGVIVIAFDKDGYAASSYGATGPECQDLGKLLDAICAQIDVGDLQVWRDR